MTHAIRFAALAAACLGLAGPTLAAEVIGAGSGSNGGMVNGKTNESTQMEKTGAANGGETVPSKEGKHDVGTGDNAVLTAPREAVPGTQPGGAPTNLNGGTQP